MKCADCQENLSLDEAREWDDQYLCETCYIDRTSAPRPCDAMGVATSQMHRAVLIPEEVRKEVPED